MKIACVLFFLVILFSTDSRSQTRRSLEFDPDDPPETTIRIAPYLTFGGQLEFEYKLERNLDLDEQDEDISTFEPGLGVAFSFDPTPNFQAFFATTFFWELIVEDSEKISDMLGLEIEQAYILFGELVNKGLSFQLGRQRFEDEREWLFDEELDAVRFFTTYQI